MPTTSGAHGRSGTTLASLPGACWRREFPGDERELRVLRRWLASLLPPCPARDDVVVVANELGSNAIRHTRSGHGGRFTVEVTWHAAVVRVAVADGGAATGPVEIDDPGGEHGRGLVVVRELSVRRGACGGHLGRLVWADVAWDSMPAAVAVASPAGQEAAIRDDEAALASCFAGVPAWFGRSTLARWALAGPGGLVSAPTARELAGLLCRLLDAPDLAPSPAAGHVYHGSASERLALYPRRQPGAGDQGAARWRHPGTARSGFGGKHGHPARTGRPAVVPELAAAGPAPLVRA